MSTERVERRLTAILAADVAGYSRLMGADEERTLAQLKDHRRELVDPKITGGAFLISRMYSRYVARRTSPDLKRVCEKPGCLNDQCRIAACWASLRLSRLRLEAPKPRENFTAWETTRSVRMNASG